MLEGITTPSSLTRRLCNVSINIKWRYFIYYFSGGVCFSYGWIIFVLHPPLAQSKSSCCVFSQKCLSAAYICRRHSAWWLDRVSPSTTLNSDLQVWNEWYCRNVTRWDLEPWGSRAFRGNVSQPRFSDQSWLGWVRKLFESFTNTVLYVTFTIKTCSCITHWTSFVFGVSSGVKAYPTYCTSRH